VRGIRVWARLLGLRRTVVEDEVWQLGRGDRVGPAGRRSGSAAGSAGADRQGMTSWRSSAVAGSGPWHDVLLRRGPRAEGEPAGVMALSWARLHVHPSSEHFSAPTPACTAPTDSTSNSGKGPGRAAAGTLRTPRDLIAGSGG
jgi:hypothetical protein